MKKIIVILFISCAVLSCVCFAAAEKQEPLSVDDACDLIKRWEELYIKYYDVQYFYKYVEKQGGVNKEKALYYSRRAAGDAVEYVKCDDWLIIDPVGNRNEVEDLFKTVFTKEAAEKAINGSNLLFKEETAYLPSVVSTRNFSPVIDYLYDSGSDLLPLSNRVRVTSIADDKVKIEFDYYMYSNENDAVPKTETSYIIATETDDGYRVSELDELYFKTDELSDKGMRKNSFTADNPTTSDAPLITVCALALSALAAAVVLKKRG